MFPGCCCIANRHIGARERRQLIPHVRFQVPFLGRKVNWNQASHVRASSVPIYNMLIAWVNLVVIFLFVARVGLCCGFCDFAVSFLVPPDGPKNGTVKVLFFCSFTKLCMRWDRGGPIFGTVFRFIFWSFLYQGCRSAKFWFQWNFVAYSDRKSN